MRMTQKVRTREKRAIGIDGIHCAPSCFTAVLDTEWNMCGLFTSTKTSGANSLWWRDRKREKKFNWLFYPHMDVCSVSAQIHRPQHNHYWFSLFYVKSSNKWIRCFSFQSMYDSMLSGTWHRMSIFAFFSCLKRKIHIHLRVKSMAEPCQYIPFQFHQRCS